MPFHNLDELRRESAGRWAEILVAAGIPAKILDGRNHPCPKCGGRDRFAVFRDLNERGAVHCRNCFTRGTAIAPSDGIATIRWWLDLTFAESLVFLAETLGVRPGPSGHPPSGRTPSGLTRPGATVSFPSVSDIPRHVIEAHTEFARAAYGRIGHATRGRLAEQILVSADALTSLRVGITSDERGSTWPMRNETGDVIGVRIVGLPWTEARNAKWSRRGSQSGLFVARGARAGDQRSDQRSDRQRGTEDGGTLFVTEGASDTATAIGLGLWAIGRASCNSSTFFVDRYVNLHQPSSLIIIADHDDAGRTGAKRLAKSLCQNLPRSLSHVDIIAPPRASQDLRDWISDGGSQADIRNATPIASYTAARQTTFDFR